MIDKQCYLCLSTAADPSRIFILEYLKKNKEASLNDIVKKIKLRQPTVTFHINKMVESGMINKKKQGREVFLTIHKRYVRCDTCPIMD